MPVRPSRCALVPFLLAATAAAPARAQVDAGGAVAQGAEGGPAAAGEPRVWASCVEHVPPGASRPVLRERIDARATSGYALPLEVTVEHGAGETVLPQGFHVQAGSDAARAIAEAGFALPDPAGGAGPTKTTVATGATGAGRATTTVVVPFVPLPRAPGRNTLTLPPVPIAVARASGDLVTVCTQPHPVVVEDPIASTPDAKPRENPDPRLQREEWTLARQLATGALAGAVAAALAAWLVARWMRRPRQAPPPPPPRPPWETALEEIEAIRRDGLVAAGRLAEHCDRVSDAVRRYLGGRYGFDGIEMTTHEVCAIVRRVRPEVAVLPAVEALLEECDLVKFARMTPTAQDCDGALDAAERIVRGTIPAIAAGAGAGVPPGATS